MAEGLERVRMHLTLGEDLELPTPAHLEELSEKLLQAGRSCEEHPGTRLAQHSADHWPENDCLAEGRWTWGLNFCAEMAVPKQT